MSNFFFFNDTATTEIYTLSLHDALPICSRTARPCTPSTSRDSVNPRSHARTTASEVDGVHGDRKSTRLNSSHLGISYAVFCLKRKQQLHQRSYHRSTMRLAAFIA